MIRARLFTNVTPLDNSIAAFEAVDEVMAEAGRKVTDQIRPQALDELGYYPGISVHPFVWSLNRDANRRAQRYYFAAIARGEIQTDGQRYIRSGELGKSFFVEGDTDGGTFTLAIGSRYKALKWVTGTMDVSRRWQIPGHARTGWPLMRPTVVFWLDAAQELMENELPMTMLNTVHRRVNR